MPRLAWPDERVDKLRELHKQGLTFKAIGEIFGESRNAIAGACRRYHLPERIDKMARKAKKESKGSGRKKLNARLIKLAKPIIVRPAPMRVKPTHIPEPAPLNLDILALTDSTCKWSMSASKPHVFCGNPTVPGKAWCGHHYGRVFE